MSIIGVLSQIVIALILYVITKAVYNLKFHPLAKYPGPKLWIASRISYLICMNKGQLPFRVKELHEKYGPVVRVSADELSFNDGRAWKDIFSRKDMLRPPQWGARPPGVEAHNVISAPAGDHVRFRKALTPAFSEKNVYEYEPVIRSYFDKLISRLDVLIQDASSQEGKASKSAIIDIVEWANYTTFDVIGELSWSKSYDCLEKGSGHTFMDVLLHFQAVLIGASISYFPWLNWLVAKITPKSAFQMLENIFQDAHERLATRIERGTAGHADLITHISEHNAKSAPEDRLTAAEIEQNVLAIIVGGSETLTTTISGAFHYLLADRAKLERVTKELRSSFSSEREISGKKVARLSYTNAVIEETLRMCPPIPDMLRRQVPKDEHVRIAGHIIPAGTTVSVSCYAMFNSSDHFSAPERFEPMRFTKDDLGDKWIDPAFAHNDLSVFHPFSIGPHNCLGQPLARLEMRLLIAIVLYNYDIRVPDGEILRKWTDQNIYWTWEKQPLKIEISKPRHFKP